MPNITISTPVETPSQTAHRYPNPGFLGQSSHSTIFAQMASTAHHDTASCPLQDSVFFECGTERPPPDESPDTVDKVSQLLKHFLQLKFAQLRILLQSWHASGTNLALAEPLTARFSDATVDFLQKWNADLGSESFARQKAHWLLRNSRQSIDLTEKSNTEDFFSQTMGDNLRLEVLGIFLTAACRAVMDIPSFTPLYTSHRERVTLARSLMSIGDLCLECCLSLDSLNDLQLVLQYENMIVHTQVDGDQSYHSWRRMGDISSSLFALGYHQLPDTSTFPPFILQLRKAGFARIYTADKMLAVFLGRPPRIAREYCTTTLPCNDSNLWQYSFMDTDANGHESPSNPGIECVQGFSMPKEPFNHMADTRSRARFSFLKEDILKFSRRHPPSELDNAINIEVAQIFNEIESAWNALPEHLRLTKSLKLSDASPFSNDLLIGIRLDYLHTLFLLHLASSRQLQHPGRDLLAIAGEMLSLVTEAIMLRDRLVNSGTSLTWKVAQYGLPAAGIISLSLLNVLAYDDWAGQRTKCIQDLNILVAKLKVGAIVRAGEANFALFSRATRTMQSLLNLLADGTSMISQRTQTPDSNIWNLTGDLNLFANFEPWDFEFDFWASLADHPGLNVYES
ncbi:hypothetical protein KAF25_002025 [Fusarium avenaceum]|uniref:Xylanolytic transcriptional activator regulatory domain-containing protein n=1 Tax=Fusarium avenaceum TaxID=40199 RepID=A0A9P7GZE3_9HYPO|nr:hypothetical protein KAF25_002025 [Fusarium avenaceum]